MAPPALLLVFSDPGDAVSEADFNDWYDGEHVPLRVNTPAFLTWRRLRAVDDQSLPWAALYDLTSYDDTQKPPYTTLAETRSDREKDILSRIRLLDRRTYELYQGAPIFPPSPDFDEKVPAPIVTFVTAELTPEGEEEYNKFYDEEHIPLFSKVPGWLRSRRFVLKEWNQLGKEAQSHTPPPKYLAVHEWSTTDAFDTEEFKSTLDTPWRKKVLKDITKLERHIYKHYKSWERK